ncbi:Glutathione S-transferase U8 [Linum perenne]
MEGVKLLGFWGSPFSNRVELALKLKGVDYEYIEQDLSNKDSLLLKLNPVHKKVPVLIHNDKLVVESLVILEYIDETWPNGHLILPRDPYEKAVARFWAKFIDEKVQSIYIQVTTVLISFQLNSWVGTLRGGAERERVALLEMLHLKTLEDELKNKRFFGGEGIGIVDIAANFFGYWIEVIQEVTGLELVTKDKFPVLCNWIDEFVGNSVVKEILPPKDKLFALFKARLSETSWKY